MSDVNTPPLSMQERALLRIDTVVQKYRIERLIGVGGMAVVYAARHRNGHPVAMKFLLERYADEPHIRQLFAREAYAANRVGHIRAVPVLDDDVDDRGCPFLVMPLLEGEAVRKRWDRANRRLPLSEVVVIIADALDVLASAHAKGIVHRDVKPDNLFITTKGDVYVLDFGIARHLGGDGTGATITGHMMGTPAFMPPEQALGEREAIGPHSDCWAVGATMFALLSGELVHKAESGGAQLAAAATRHARSIASVVPDLAPALVTFVDKALEFDPADRWQTAREMHAALLAALDAGGADCFATLAPPVRAELAAELSNMSTVSETLPPVREGRGGNRLESPMGTPQKESLGPPIPTRRSGNDPVTVLAAGMAKPKPRKHGRAWTAALMVIVLAIGGFFVARTVRTEAPSPAASASGVSTSALSSGTKIVDLPISRTCREEAETHYREGLTALQQASWENAYAALEKAAATDPRCPEVQLQFMIVAETLRPLAEVREHYQRVVSLRASLNERDRTLLDAFAPLITLDPGDRKDHAHRLDSATTDFPNDAQLAMMAASAHLRAAPDLPSVEYALESAQRATYVDPHYADAWQSQAQALLHLGRLEEAMRAIDTCLEVAPGSTDCLAERIRTLRSTGECPSVVADARRWIAKTPASAYAYIQLANGLASNGASSEAVDAALEQWRRNERSTRADMVHIHFQTLLSVLHGDFVAARKAGEQMLAAAQKSSVLFDHARSSAVFADLLIETGKPDAATSLAQRFLREKDAWTDGFWPTNEYEPFLVAISVKRAQIAHDRWPILLEGWEKHTETTLTKRQRWAFRWAPMSDVQGFAEEAWRHRPDEIATARVGGEQWYYPSLVKIFEGRIALMAGENAEAVHLLGDGVKSCHFLQIPFETIRAHLWLGEAKERVGDTVGACDAYGVVLKRWNNAKPRSVTAEEARRRSLALGCKSQ